MGKYSQLIFYGFCILLVNNISNSEATFFSLLGQASSASHPAPAAAPRIAPQPAAPAASGGAGDTNSILLSKLTQISSKLNLLLGGLGNGAAVGNGVAAGNGNGNGNGAAIAVGNDDDAGASADDDTADEAAPKMDDDGGAEGGEGDAPAEEENEIAETGGRAGTLGNGRATNGRQQGNGIALRKSITTSNSGRAASINTGSRSALIRVNSQPSGTISQTIVRTSGGYNYQAQPTVQRNYYQAQPTVQRSYYQAQPTVQRNYYQAQPVQRTVRYVHYQNPPYQYRTVRHY